MRISDWSSDVCSSDLTNCVQNYRGLNQGVVGLNISSNCRQVQIALGQYFAVQVPLKRYNAFARLTYEFSPEITGYAQFGYLRSEAFSRTGPGSSKPSAPLLVPQNNPFLTGNADLRAILNSITPTPTGNIIVTKALTTLGNRLSSFDNDVWQAVLGLKGEIPGTSLQWNVYGSYGKSKFVNVMAGDISLAAVTSVLNGTANYSGPARSEEHTSELQSLMRTSHAVFCLKKKKNNNKKQIYTIKLYKYINLNKTHQ